MPSGSTRRPDNPTRHESESRSSGNGNRPDSGIAPGRGNSLVGRGARGSVVSVGGFSSGSSRTGGICPAPDSVTFDQTSSAELPPGAAGRVQARVGGSAPDGAAPGVVGDPDGPGPDVPDGVEVPGRVADSGGGQPDTRSAGLGGGRLLVRSVLEPIAWVESPVPELPGRNACVESLSAPNARVDWVSEPSNRVESPLEV